ncbi:MAG: Tim44 domain-containing protein [Burkholderiales bacterium]|nr:Tim44 domain-containing protein [Burkholderiales bacterium]
MKRILLSLFMAVLSLGFITTPVEAKRLGGSGSSGMQRQTPPPAKPAATPNPTPTPAGAAAAAPKRSWMGPLAGIAAGLGIAALMSHLGLGAEMGSFLTMILLAVAAVFLVRFLLRRFGPKVAASNGAPQGMQFAGAGPSLHGGPGFGSGGAVAHAASAQPAPAVSGGHLPPGFDAPAFERIAKLIFIRMQAANDAGNLDDLRQFATPEMFATFRLDLQERQSSPQQTDVVQLNAQVLDFAQEADRLIVSVRFHGLIREERDAPAAPFDEIWHLVKPADGSREWAIAGIGQNSTH